MPAQDTDTCSCLLYTSPGLKKTFAELSPEEKNAISHRGNALKAFREKLETYLKK